MRKILQILISFSVLPIAIFSVQRFSASPLGSTTFWWLIEAAILLVFWVGRYSYFGSENKQHFRIIKWYLFWVIICLIRGIFIAEIYWDYKALIGNTFALFLPLIAYIATDNQRVQSILTFFVRYALPLSLLVLPFLPLGDWGWYLFPISFLVLFFPLLKLHWKITLILISLVAILGDLSVRSHVFKYGVPFFLLFLYYLRFFVVSVKMLESVRIVFMILPWFFFFLAVSGIFNVFKINEYIKGSYVQQSVTDEGEIKQQDLTQDSRTFMYKEVLGSAIKYDYWLFGRSPARGNETIVFAKISEEFTGRRERMRNEANIPNVFTWLGVIGVVLYFFVFYKATYLSINHSNNIYSKLIGLFIAFRWMYAWVEDPYMFGMNDFVIWLMIGTCFSHSFRAMNNVEVKLWARGIFERKYIKYMKYIKKDVPSTMHKLN